MIKKYNYETPVYDENFIKNLIENNDTLKEIDISFFNIKTLHSIFKSTTLEKLILPRSLEEIKEKALYSTTALKTIEFRGTIDEWNAIKKASNWKSGTKTIKCLDGSITV